MYIRKAEHNDIELIHNLGFECFRATYTGRMSEPQMDFMLDMMYSVENITRQIHQLGHVYYIGYQDDEPFGFVSLECQAPALYHLQKIYLRESAQGKGLGRVLIEYAFDRALTDCGGECTVELNVNRGNQRAIDFYNKMGMHCDRTGDFAIGEGFYMNDYIMAIKLGAQQ
ncbi:MAG: GNAT family N-acetyltransferase [Rikenellaceae bacterium]